MKGFFAFLLQMFSPPMHCESKGSPSPEKNTTDQDSKANGKDKSMDPAFPQLYDQPRHIQYATHFPIPQVRTGLDKIKNPPHFCALQVMEFTLFLFVCVSLGGKRQP